MKPGTLTTWATLLLSTGFLGLLACHGRSREGASNVPADAAPWSGVTLDLTPDPARHEVRVHVSVSADLARRVRELRVARSWARTRAADGVSAVRVEDGLGALAFTRDKLDPDATEDAARRDEILHLAREAKGALDITYRAAAVTREGPLALHVDEGGMTGVGHAFLLLPRLDAEVPARVRFHTEALGRGAEGASSFGVGESVETRASTDDLAHAVYAAGMLWREPGVNGDEMIVLGNPAFDTKTAVGRVEAARSAIARYLGPTPGGDAPMRFLLVGRPELGKAREGAFLGRSLGVWFDAKEPFDDDLAGVVGHELTHAFLGGRATLTCPGGAEARWFAEGFTVFAARRALLAAGVLSREGFAADIDRLHGARDPSLPDDYRRGDHLAALMDEAMFAQSSGKAQLADVLRELVAAGAAAPVSALVRATRARSEAAAAIAERGASLLCADRELDRDLDRDAFGGCVERRTVDEPAIDVGFDRASVEQSPAVLRGVVPGSAAAKAGLFDGALVVRASLPGPTDASPLVDLSLGDGRRVRYKPATSTHAVRWVATTGAACSTWLAKTAPKLDAQIAR